MGMGLITKEQLIEMMLDTSDPYISGKPYIENNPQNNWSFSDDDDDTECCDDEEEYFDSVNESIDDDDDEEEEFYEQQQQEAEYNERLNEIRREYGYGTNIAYGEDLDEAEQRCKDDEFLYYDLWL